MADVVSHTVGFASRQASNLIVPAKVFGLGVRKSQDAAIGHELDTIGIIQSQGHFCIWILIGSSLKTVHMNKS